MILRDKYGWPVERTEGKHISNFFRLLFLTNIRQTLKRRNGGETQQAQAQLEKMLSELENKLEPDMRETYTTGYRLGHRDGQIELLKFILGKPNDVTTAPEKGDSRG